MVLDLTEFDFNLVDVLNKDNFFERLSKNDDLDLLYNKRVDKLTNYEVIQSINFLVVLADRYLRYEEELLVK